MPNNSHGALIAGAGTTIIELAPFVDGYPTESHRMKTNIHSEPLENGTKVTDLAVAAPDIITVEGWVSNFNGGDRVDRADIELKRLQERGEPVTFVSEWAVHHEMVIVDVDIPKTTRGIKATIRLQQIKRVGVTVNDLPAESLFGPAVGRSGEITRGRVVLGQPTRGPGESA